MRRFLLALSALITLAALASPAHAEPVSNTVQRVLSDSRKLAKADLAIFDEAREHLRVADEIVE